MVNSTGITGLTATLDSGILKYGDSVLSFALSGTPSTNGIAAFQMSVGGKACSFELKIEAPFPDVASLGCATASLSSPLESGSNTAGIVLTVNYTGGNNGSYAAQNLTSTGVTGVSASLAAGRLNLGNGALSYLLSGVPNGSGKLRFNITIGAKNCTYEVDVPLPAASVGSLDCGLISYVGTLKQNEEVTGASFMIPYTSGNGGTFNSMNISSSLVSGLTASINGGTLLTGNGNLNFIVEGVPESGGTAVFRVILNGKSCTARFKVEGESSSIISTNRPTDVYVADKRAYFHSFSQSIHIEIMDIHGKVLHKEIAPSTMSSMSLENLPLHTGVYLLKYYSGDKTGILRFGYESK